MVYSDFLLKLQQQPSLITHDQLEEVASKLPQFLPLPIHYLKSRNASKPQWFSELKQDLMRIGFSIRRSRLNFSLNELETQLESTSFQVLEGSTSEQSLLLLSAEKFQPDQLSYGSKVRLSWQSWLERTMAENDLLLTIWSNRTHFGLVLKRANGSFWRAKLSIDDLSSNVQIFTQLALACVFGKSQIPILDELISTPQTSRRNLVACLESQLPKALKLLCENLSIVDLRRISPQSSDQELSKIGLHSVVVLILRAVFCLYAEHHSLLPTENPIYAESYGLSTIECDSSQVGIWQRTVSLFHLVYRGSQHPSLNLPGYYGELFCPEKTPLLEIWQPKDSVWSQVLDLLNNDKRNKHATRLNWLNYEPECLGMLYQITLNFELVISNGQVTLKANRTQRQTGTFYTPRQEAKTLVKETLLPLVYTKEDRLKSVRELLALKICDFAAGSGALLVETARQLSNYVVEAWKIQQTQLGNASIACLPYGDSMRDFTDEPIPFQQPSILQNCARRLVVERCIYGVDLNPIAIEIARMSLWLLTAAKNKALSFVDHAVIVGDSLLGLTSRQLIHAEIPLIQERIPLFRQLLADQIFDAQTIRQELQQITVLDNDQVVLKQRLLKKSCMALQKIELAANQIIQTWVHNPSELESQFAKLLSGSPGNPGKVEESLQTQLLSAPVHWPLKFPEVFQTGDNFEGFDAIIANPPFCGTRRLNRFVGPNYHHYLKTALAKKALGGLDLCLFFLYRASQLVKPGGMIGFLTTSSMTEGRNRTLGLRPFLKDGWRLTHAKTQFNWPGQANLDVCLVHFTSDTAKLQPRLDGHNVAEISSRLDSLPETEAKNLREFLPVHAFQGSSPGRKDFIVEATTALEWLKTNALNHKVLKPYLRGQDIQQSVELYPEDWIIDFRDMQASEAQQFESVFKHLQHQKSKLIDKNWWRHTNYRPKLYKQIQSMESVLIKARISPWHVIEKVPANWCFADGVIVIASNDSTDFALYQSIVHEIWTRHFSSKLQRSCRYAIGDAFETFPRPESHSETEDELQFLVDKLLKQRRIAQAARNCGLSYIYRKLNQQDQLEPEFHVLRIIHDQINKLIMSLYGWDDIECQYKIQTQAGVPIRSLIKEQKEELLRRLLQRNAALFAQSKH